MENPPDVIAARAEWTKGLHDLAPGTHVVVVGAQPGHCAEGRRAGLEFRDTIVVSTDRGTTLAALFRKPLDGTVIEQVLRTGTGGIWIDGCRTGYQSEADKRLETRGVHVGGAYKHPAGNAFQKAVNAVASVHDGGRWPTNLVLVHSTGCRQEGTRRVRTGTAYEPQPKRMNRSVFGETNTLGRTVSFADNDGMETISAWICTPCCPVASLDGQSGDRKSGGDISRGASKGTEATYNYENTERSPFSVYSDSGGASRFYPQFVGTVDAHDWLARLV